MDYVDMPRPYVIVHSLSSIDGRTNEKYWNNVNACELFEGPGAEIDWDAWLVGRKTMQGYSSKNVPQIPPKGAGNVDIQKVDFVGQHHIKKYAVVIDPSGKLYWDTNMATTEHVIEVLSENVSQDYLRHLRHRNVSYIFAGKTPDSIDLNLTLQKLKKMFGINKIRVDGGGTVNGSFLKAGLVDEISLLVAPVADGNKGSTTVFDAVPCNPGRMATPLKLEDVKKLDQYPGVVWLRYKVQR